jgi:hypothetical protein
MTGRGGTLPLTTSGHVRPGNFVNLKGGTGNYLVLKMRTHKVTALNWRLSSASETIAEVEPSGDYIARRSDFVDDQWVTYVINIKDLLTLSPDVAKTYGQAGDMSRNLLAAGFMYGMHSGDINLTDAYVDVSYFAVCDSWEEVEMVTRNDKTVSYTAWANNANIVDKKSDGSNLFVSEGENADKVVYQKTGNKMYVYVRSNVEGVEKYTRYEFKRITDDSRKLDTWKISSIDICDSSLNFLYSTVVGACECEAAIKENGAADFVGGWHGDEYMTAIKILVDGEELDLSKDYDFAGCESIQAVVESYLNRCDTEQKLFERVKIDTWTKDGLVINNKFTVLDNVFVHRAATSMLAISFKDGIITDHRNTNLAWTAIPDYQKQNESGITFDTNGVTWAEFRGKINVRVEMTDNKINGVLTAVTGSFNYDHFGGDNRRVKIYIEPAYNFNLYAGDVFECTSTQSIFAAE